MSDAQTNALSLISGVVISGHTNSKESLVEMVYDNSLPHDSCKLDLENIDVYYDSENPECIDVINETKTKENSFININVDEEEKVIDLQTTSNVYRQSVKRKSIEETKPIKKTSISSRLSDSNLAAKKLGDIATKKLELKTEYYSKKLKIMEEHVSVLKTLGTVLSTFINSNNTH